MYKINSWNDNHKYQRSNIAQKYFNSISTACGADINTACGADINTACGSDINM